MNCSSVCSPREEAAGLGVEVVELALDDRDQVPGDVVVDLRVLERAALALARLGLGVIDVELVLGGDPLGGGRCLRGGGGLHGASHITQIPIGIRVFRALTAAPEALGSCECRLRLCGILIVAASLGLCASPANAAAAKKPKLSIAAASVTEGNAGTSSITFAVKLSKKSKKPVSADYATADGSATAPSDYASSRGTVTVKRKKTRAEITIAVAGDTSVESNETFLVVLSNPKRAKLAAPTAQGTIVNDDSAPPNTDPPGTDPPVPTGADIQLAGVRLRPAPVRGGSPVDEQLTVTNAGPEGADGVSIAVTLPAGSVLNTTWSSPSCSAGGSGRIARSGHWRPGRVKRSSSQPMFRPRTRRRISRFRRWLRRARRAIRPPGTPASSTASRSGPATGRLRRRPSRCRATG